MRAGEVHITEERRNDVHLETTLTTGNVCFCSQNMRTAGRYSCIRTRLNHRDQSCAQPGEQAICGKETGSKKREDNEHEKLQCLSPFQGWLRLNLRFGSDSHKLNLAWFYKKEAQESVLAVGAQIVVLP